MIPSFVEHWSRELDAPKNIVQLRGGFNNIVFRCDASTKKYVIKSYRPPENGEQDRMQSEVRFLQYSARVAKDYVPQLLHIDQDRRCIVLEFIDGQIFPDGIKPSQRDILLLVDFLRSLNLDRKIANQYSLPSAAEGFLRLTEHLENVRERIGKMDFRHLPNDSQAAAKQLMLSLNRHVEKLSAIINKKIKHGALRDEANLDGLWVSPSDFGFHNAIQAPFGVKLIDFEFAGWDDPAKTVADFVLQPRIQIDLDLNLLVSFLPRKDRIDILNRVSSLGPVLRLKWVCIILSVLNPQRVTSFSKIFPAIDMQRFIKERLNSAAAYLNQELPFGLHRFYLTSTQEN